MTDRLPDGVPTGQARSDRGMTKKALLLLVALLAVPGWHIYLAIDSWTPPRGEETHEAYVETIGTPDRARPGSRPSTDWLVVRFTDPEGEPGWAMYENRMFSRLDIGDRIVIYRQDDLRSDEGQWRTMSERSLVGTAGWSAFALALLAMIYGWFRVRRRHRGRSDLAQE